MQDNLQSIHFFVLFPSVGVGDGSFNLFYRQNIPDGIVLPRHLSLVTRHFLYSSIEFISSSVISRL
jgi:hypothetical protein